MKEIKGNLIDLVYRNKFEIIVHGCNCFCTMGSGLAKEIKERIPVAFEADLKTIKGDFNKLGNFTYAHECDDSGMGFMVINAYTQFYYDARLKPLDYEALTLVFRKINQAYRGKFIGVPLIGAGLAGGDWNRIKAIIETELDEMDVTIVHYDGK